jgi:acetoin utilization deacetylase AcuC-like enzyme
MAPRPAFYSHLSSLDHDTRGHPEQGARIVAIEQALSARDWLGFERVSSPEVPRDVLQLVHDEHYVAQIQRLAAAGGGQLDPDTLLSEGSFTAAMHAVGGAVEMVGRLLEAGAGAIGFSAHRPPGHHALSGRAMGFCLFNSIAVAAAYATDRLGVERVMIVDWDVHHGNGTSDTFWGSDQVLFVSIHQWPLFPGSGRPSEIGSGAGRGYTVNLPVPAGTGDDEYLSLFQDTVFPLARLYKPQLLLVSAGFDAHRDDPLASCLVTEQGFAGMTELVRALCGDLGIPLGLVLEGGYDLAALARSVVASMEALVAEQ